MGVEPMYFWWIPGAKAGLRVQGPSMPLWAQADRAELRSALCLRLPFIPGHTPARAQEVTIK